MNLNELSFRSKFLEFSMFLNRIQECLERTQDNYEMAHYYLIVRENLDILQMLMEKLKRELTTLSVWEKVKK